MAGDWIVKDDALSIKAEQLHAGYLGEPCLVSALDGTNTIMGDLKGFDMHVMAPTANSASAAKITVRVGTIELDLKSDSVVRFLDLTAPLTLL